MTPGYKYSELDYAKDIYENGIHQNSYILTELSMLAIYMRRFLDYKPKRLKYELYLWCEKNIKEYKRETHYIMIKKAINRACKKGSTLINIEHIDFYGYELEYINSLFIKSNSGSGLESSFSYECKKLLFTLLFKMKINKMVSDAKKTDDSFEYQGKYFKGGRKKYNELKKIAKLPVRFDINSDIINTLWVNNLVTPMFNGLIRLDFMDGIYELQKDNGETDIVAFEIKNYDSVGWYFDYYNRKDNKIQFCKECGKIYKKRSNRQEYCSDECYSKNNRRASKERMRAIREVKCLH